jgi:hypothetical protein
VLAHGHQTELETLFDFGFYKYAAPDGAKMNPNANGHFLFSHQRLSVA